MSNVANIVGNIVTDSGVDIDTKASLGAANDFSPAVSATAGNAYAINVAPILTATANNDTLVGLDINPTFTNGAFTGVQNISLRLVGSSNRSMKLIAGDSTGNAYITNDTSSQITYTAGYGGHFFKFNDGTNSSTPLTISHNLVHGGNNNTSLGNSANRWSLVYSVSVSSDVYQFQGTTALAFGGYTVNTGIHFDLTNKYLNFWTNGSQAARITAAGRLLLGTVSESTYLLDVSGTTRLGGDTRITAGGLNQINLIASANGTTPYLEFLNSGVNTYRLNGVVGVSSSGLINAGGMSIANTSGTPQSLLLSNLVATSNVEVAGTRLFMTSSTGEGGILFLHAGTSYRGLIGFDAASNYLQIRTGSASSFSAGVLSTIFDSTGSVGIGGITSVNASALLQVDSTTKGFLPPRMTSTQKSAISTPATGLVVYQTDSAEGLYQYKSTGWEAIGGGGGTPAGLNTQIQYNNSGVFGASAGFTYNDSTGVLTLNKDQNAFTDFLVQNNTNASNALSRVRVKTSASGEGQFAAVCQSGSAYGVITANSFGMYGNMSNGMFIANELGDIRFGTGSANPTSKMVLTNAGRLLLGTTSESTYLLDVNGTARVSGDLTVEKNQNAFTIFEVKNTTSGTGSVANIYLTSSNSGQVRIGKSSLTTTSYKILGSGDFSLFNTNTGDIAILNDVATGNIKFAAGSASSSQMILTAAGRLLLGNVSESTYILDVAGNVRVNVGASKPIRFGQNATYSGVPSISMNDTLSDTLMAGFFADDLNFYINSPNRIIIRGSGNANNSSFVFTNTALGQGYGSYNTNPSTSSGIFIADKLGVGTNAPNASAKVQIDSTTLGFLPPRMTATQLAAISSPAVGLVAYQTDGTEGLYQYKSTGWVLVGGSGGSGTVTSVDMSVPTGFAISGNPVTTSGTLALAFASGYSLPTTASQTNWDTAYTNMITSLTTTGSSGAATLVSNVLNVPTYTLTGLGGVPTSRTLTINGTGFDLSADRAWTVSASAAGTTGQLQYNNSGSLAGAAYVNVNQGHIELVDAGTLPTAPSTGRVILFSEDHAGKSLPSVLGPSGVDYNLQAALYGNTTYMWLAGTGTTVAINWGTSFTARNNGTSAAQSHPTKASTNAMTSMNRANFGTGTTATGASGIQSAATVAWLGNAAGLGGFLFFARFGIETLASDVRAFVGLSANNATMAADASTWANTIGIGKDTADSTWQIISRSATTLTKTNTTITVTQNQILDVYIHSAPNSGTIRVHIKDGATGADLYVSGALTTNIPANTTFLYMQAHIQSVTGTTAKNLALNRMYLETDL